MTINLPSAKSVAAGLRLRVIGQHDAQLTLAVAVINHLRRLTYRASGPEAVGEFNKENVLVIGPTGCGKTHLVRSLAKLVNLPFAPAMPPRSPRRVTSAATSRTCSSSCGTRRTRTSNWRSAASSSSTRWTRCVRRTPSRT